MNKDVFFLRHILDEITEIETSLSNVHRSEFKKNRILVDATVRRIEIIGEASKNISSSLKNSNSDVQWKAMAGTRDVMVHAYFDVDLDVVWDIVQKDLPPLKKQVLLILGKKC